MTRQPRPLSFQPARHHARAMLAALLLTGSVCAHAGTEDERSENRHDTLPAIQLQGFGTLGLARSDDADARFVRDLAQPHGVGTHWSGNLDSLLGVQASLALGGGTELVLQGISQYRHDDSFSPELRWAFLRHDLSPEWGLRLGRMGTEFYMLADSRQVGYANLTVRPPPDLYGPLVVSHFDGADLAATTAFGNTLLRGKLYGGRAAQTWPLGEGVHWDISGSTIAGGHVDALWGPWQVRLGSAGIRFAREIPLNELAGRDVLSKVPALSARHTWSRFDSLGVVYDEGPVQVQAMLSRIEHESAAYEDSRSAFIIGAYRLGSLTPYLGYSRARSRPDAANGTLPGAIRLSLSQLAGRTHTDQHTLIAGLRWDLRHNLALKGQLDFIRGRPDSVFPFRDETAQWDGRMTVFSLALDFVF